MAKFVKDTNQNCVRKEMLTQRRCAKCQLLLLISELSCCRLLRNITILRVAMHDCDN